MEANMDIGEQAPKWQMELLSFKGIKSTFIIEGNVNDLYPFFEKIDAQPAQSDDHCLVDQDVQSAQSTQSGQPGQLPPPIFESASFDVTFCSGAFNLNLGNNEQFLPRAVAEMIRLARHAAVFNLLHHRAKSQDDTYFYFDPEDIPSLTAGHDVTVQLIDDYLHNDFTVICRKA